ncbi:efflux transporter outer membrane subunit [Sphingomonas sp. TF3]|uniref:efflux transporter outer membrane subunit n=1 Tax=Sphingomonas sp. TF3 TaxID=2495580 RepID=UPI000F867CD6|nr:efflux transporter outer membrane subunit [Sphingomonas sp. TF3]RUN75988.1 efflux transporter outer membrane subunit [Sphingomonas sp. TF3]
MTSTIRIAAALLASAALAGCNLAPGYVRPQGAVPAALPTGGAYPAASSDAADISKIGWQTFFTDAKLREVIALGLANNRDLRLAAANVLQARAQYRVQRADLLPTVNLGASATISNGTAAAASSGGSASSAASNSTVEVYSGNVGISSFELDLWGRLRNLSESALQSYFATEEAQRAARISLISEIASAYLTLAADQDLLAVAQETLASYDQSLQLTRAQFRIGTQSELAARQAETNYESAANDIATLRAQIAQDHNALDLLVGAPTPETLLPQGLGDTDRTLNALPGDLQSSILLRRPDVLQAEHQLIAQNANIGAARAAMFPTISLTTSFGTVSSALSGLFGANSQSWSVAPGATLPIFDFGRRKGNLDLARAQQQGAVATYEKTLQTAFREVADALATRGTIDAQIGARTRRASAAEISARLSDARYRAGVDSFLTSLDAQRTAYSARRDLVTTRLARATNLVTLYRVLGGGLS